MTAQAKAQPNAHTQGYNRASIALHWVTVGWIVVMMILGIAFNDMKPGQAMYQPLATSHIVLGLFGFFFFLFRAARRLRNGFPPNHGHKLVERVAARAVQLAFLLLLIIIPLSGMLVVLAQGWAAPFGLELQAFDALHAHARLLATIHDALSKALQITLLLHVSGAIKHSIVDRDGTMGRMLRADAMGK